MKRAIRFERTYGQTDPNYRKALYLRIVAKAKLRYFSEIQWDKTMADKLMYILFLINDTQNYPFCRLQLLFEMFRHSTSLTNQSNSIRSPQSCKVND